MTSNSYFKFLSVMLLLLVFQSEANANPKVNGKWYVELNIQGIGIFRTLMNFESGDDNFKAYTREGAVKDYTSIFSTPMARMLPFVLENGSLIRIDEGKIIQNGSNLNLEGSFISLTGKYNLNAIIFKDSLTATLKKDETVVGTINGSRKNVELPFADYGEIIDNIIGTTNSNIFNGDVLNSDKWKEFKKHLVLSSKLIQDDAEMMFAFFYFANDLPFSHYNLTRDIKKSNSILEAFSEKNGSGNLYEMRDYDKNTCYLKIASFSGTSREIDSLFKIINSKNCSNLIIDLRDNRGGSINSGLRTAQYLINADLDGGIFLARKWYENNNGIPKPEDYKNYPAVSEANQELFMATINQHGAIKLTAKPLVNRFQGNVFILTNKNTGSTCEPLVYGLQQNKYATIVGEKTAGAMMSSEKFDVGEEFVIIIPTADFFTSDGFHIDGTGVKPDVETKSSNALDYVLNKIK
jgi:hypothetical protein